MNRHEPNFLGGQEAVLDYGDRIPLEELRYWSVDHNEAYASPEAVLQRVRARLGR